MQRKVGIVVFTHGSRRDGGNQALLEFVTRLRARLGNERIEPAFMDLAEPTIPDAIARLLASGCDHIRGFALFLVPGSHLREDVPSLFRQALANHPGITWEISPPLLEDPAMLDYVAVHLENR